MLVEFVQHLRKTSTKGQALSGRTVNRFLSFISTLFSEAVKYYPDYYRPPVIPWEREDTKYKQQLLSR
jgi:predicted metal-dependent hydrolase